MPIHLSRPPAVRCATLVTLAALGAVGPAVAQDSAPASRGSAPDPLAAVAAQIAGAVSPEPTAATRTLFSKAFLNEVPWPRMEAIFKTFHASHGPVVKTTEISRDGALSGQFRVTFQKQASRRMTLALAPGSREITGLVFSDAVPEDDSLERVAAAMGKLRGRTAVAMADLDATGDPRFHDGQRSATSLAMGSTFKLYVLGALIAEIREGRRHLEDVVAIHENWKSFPSGQLHDWPDGAPVTLHSLASLMISVSDNTATDHLMRILGRERIEAMLPVMGHSSPASTVPFLATREMFALKGDPAQALAGAYVAADIAGRRTLLDALAGRPRSDFASFAAPYHVTDIEWFASPEDVVRAWDWIRRNTETGPAAPCRALSGINKGLRFDVGATRFVGFKGGSEPGVLMLSFLIETRAGRWKSVVAGWNRDDSGVDEPKFMALVQRYLDLAVVDS